MTRRKLAFAGALAFAMATAHASLIDRGGGLIYDDVLKITWLSDANYAATQFSGHGNADGQMTWTAAKAWAAGLSYGGYDDWRLPMSLNQDGGGPCAGYFCTNSEMGHMFYNNLGVSAGSSILTGTNTANLALFTNLLSDRYWSGTVFASNPDVYAWGFHNDEGDQYRYLQSSTIYAWAVRPGDVVPSAIPEPATFTLLGLGLVGLVTSRCRKR